MEIFLSLLFSPPKNSAIRYPHLGKEVAGLELAKIGVALDGGGGCVFFWSLGEVDEKGVEGEKKVAERLKKNALLYCLFLPLQFSLLLHPLNSLSPSVAAAAMVMIERREGGAVEATEEEGRNLFWLETNCKTRRERRRGRKESSRRIRSPNLSTPPLFLAPFHLPGRNRRRGGASEDVGHACRFFLGARKRTRGEEERLAVVFVFLLSRHFNSGTEVSEKN